MAQSLRELLKEVENEAKEGFKNGQWSPHKSVEGGTRTVAYGHKLSEEEDQGNYIILPSGDVVDLDTRGLTPEEAEQLLDSDINKKRNVAKTQWNNSQDTPFDQLDPLHKELLTEITFNIGTLKNKSGSFGWPSLAEGIVNNDKDKIKSELMRSYTDEETGEKIPLTGRVDKIKQYVDSAWGQEKVEEQAPQPQPPEMTIDSFVNQLMSSIEERNKSRQNASESVSEPVVEEEQDPQQDVSYESFLSKARSTLQRDRNEDEAGLERKANEARLAAEAEEAERSVKPKKKGSAMSQDAFGKAIAKRAKGLYETEAPVYAEESEDEGSELVRQIF